MVVIATSCAGDIYRDGSALLADAGRRRVAMMIAALAETRLTNAISIGLP
jgi:hypothetical protein